MALSDVTRRRGRLADCQNVSHSALHEPHKPVRRLAPIARFKVRYAVASQGAGLCHGDHSPPSWHSHSHGLGFLALLLPAPLYPVHLSHAWREQYDDLCRMLSNMLNIARS